MNSNSGTKEERAGLAICGIAKAYNGRPVLRDVSLKLKRGEVVGLLGPSAGRRHPIAAGPASSVQLGHGRLRGA